MVLERDELMERIRNRIGDGTSDDDIALLEDVADTYDDLNANARENIDWRRKYEDLDQSWRQRYIDRFNGKVESDVDFVEAPTAEDDETELEYEAPKTYEELFEV